MDMHSLSRLTRRVLSMVAIGQIKTIVDSANVQTAQVTLNQFETIDAVPRVPEFGFTSSPPIDSEAVVLFAAGDRSNGVILGTNDPSTRPTGLISGETKLYNAQGIYIYLAASGLVVDAAGMPVTVQNASTVDVTASTSVTITSPKVTITGNLLVGGDITDTSGSNAETMATMRTKYNEHDHEVTNVESGSATVTSETPSPTM